MERATHEGAMPPSTMTTRGPSWEDWERQRSKIKQLYVDEDRTLQRRYGHHGTRVWSQCYMYKSRIKAWKLDKKNKKHEMLAILRKKTQRDATGKASCFRVRGRPVDLEDVLQYANRKKNFNFELETEAKDPPTPSDVSCYTPDRMCSPQPWTADLQGDHLMETDDVLASYPKHDASAHPGCYDLMGLNSGSLQNDPGWAFIDIPLQSPTIPQALLPLATLLIPEKLFTIIKSYISGSVDTQKWVEDEYGQFVAASATCGTSPEDFERLCYTAARPMNRKSFIEGRLALSKAFRMVKDMLIIGHPSTLELLLKSIFHMVAKEFEKIATIMRSYISQMAAKILPRDTPLRNICILLGNPDVVDIGALVRSSLDCVAVTWSGVLGPLHPRTVRCQVVFINTFTTSDAEQCLHKLLANIECLYGRSDGGAINVLGSLVTKLYDGHKYGEALALVKDFAVRALQPGLEGILTCVTLLIAMCRSMLEEKLVESTMRETIEIVGDLWGRADPRCIDLICVLETWLRKWGREDEADELRAEIWGLLGPDESDQEVTG